MTTVGFIPCLPPGLHPGMDALAHGIAAELAPVGVALRVFPADLRGGATSVALGQSRAIEAALAHGVDGLILFVLDAREPEAAVQAALARRVPVIAVHKPAYPVSAALMVPNYHHGVVLGHALARALPRRREAPHVAILGGPDIVDDVELVRGAAQGLLWCGVELVNDPFARAYRNLDDVRGAGRRAAEQLLDEHYPFDGWLVFNDETLLDALAALDARGLGGCVPTVSRNGSPEVIAEVRSGRTTATLDYHLPEIGRLAGRTALAALAGALAPDTLVAAPFGELFTASNADAYVPWRERVPHDPLVVVSVRPSDP